MLVAAALAFVVLNMGMFTAQKSKEVIARAYEESTRALDVAGSVIANVAGYDNPSTANLSYIAIPVKLTAGARAIDLSKTGVSVMVVLPDGTSKYYDNATVTTNISSVQGDISTAASSISLPNGTLIGAGWAVTRGNTNNLLEPGEIALLIVKFDNSATGISVGAYSRIVVEIKPPEGSVITIERTVPPMLTSEFVNLDIG